MSKHFKPAALVTIAAISLITTSTGRMAGTFLWNVLIHPALWNAIALAALATLAFASIKAVVRAGRRLHASAARVFAETRRNLATARVWVQTQLATRQP